MFDSFFISKGQTRFLKVEKILQVKDRPFKIEPNGVKVERV